MFLVRSGSPVIYSRLLRHDILRLLGKQEGSERCPCINRVIYLSASLSPFPSRSFLFLSLSRLNDDGNSLCTRHLEEASTTLSQPLEHFHERRNHYPGRPFCFNIGQNTESCTPLTLATAGKSGVRLV